ncbi:IS3 family transposase [Streptomyces scopuliridis]|uniref:IS3 family transposase n=1 Tax=Streptomyces scopuliridis TaxID=452529 RepID=UPI0036AFA3F2
MVPQGAPPAVGADETRGRAGGAGGAGRCFFDRSGEMCGSLRITLVLWEEGRQVSQNTFAEIMAELGLQGRKPPRRSRSPTRPGKRKTAPDRESATVVGKQHMWKARSRVVRSRRSAGGSGLRCRCGSRPWS